MPAKATPKPRQWLVEWIDPLTESWRSGAPCRTYDRAEWCKLAMELRSPGMKCRIVEIL